MPRSAVCLNHDGSRELKEAAIWSRLGSGSSIEVVFECAALLWVATTESGRLLDPPILDVGLRCCHDSVPDRAKFVALCAGEASGTELRCGVVAVEEALVVLDLLSAPNPLKSGTSSTFGDCLSGSVFDWLEPVNRCKLSLCAVVSREPTDEGGVIAIGGGLARLALVVVRDKVNVLRLLGVEIFAFSGESERARSVEDCG